MEFLICGSKNFSSEGYRRAAKTWDNTCVGAGVQLRSCDAGTTRAIKHPSVSAAPASKLEPLRHQQLHLTMMGGARMSHREHRRVMERKLTGKELAARGATLLMVCRNAERGKQAVEQVRAQSGNQDVHLKVCDVSSLVSIQSLVKDLQASHQQQGVHVLVNNAGVMVHKRQQTEDGLDVNFATNTLGCFVLTLLLRDLLYVGAPSKVIFVSSGGMLTQKLDVEDLQNQGMGKAYNGTVAYAKDKRRQVAIAERLAELWAAKGVHVYSMHPGWTTTEGVKKSIPGFYSFYQEKFRNLPQGADTIVWLALQDDSQLLPGGFYLDRSPQEKHLSLGFTKYDRKQVDTLFSKLHQLAAKVLSQELSQA